MNPPDELMVAEFLPALRLLASHSLKAQGLSQGRIAALLGVTQASVSNYLGRPAEEAYATLARYTMSRGESMALAELASEKSKVGRSEAVMVLLAGWDGILGRGDACARHRELVPSLEGCDVCLALFGHGRSAVRGSVEDVAEAVRVLESSPSFAAIMPEVAVNVAGIAGSSVDPKDVVAVPGKLANVRGRAKALQPPEPGASKHLARILLLVREERKDLRGCVNVKFDQRVASAMKALRLRPLRIPRYGASRASDPTVGALAVALSKPHEKFDAVVDPGGPGVEANAYLFGESASSAADLAVRVAERYSAG